MGASSLKPGAFRRSERRARRVHGARVSRVFLKSTLSSRTGRSRRARSIARPSRSLLRATHHAAHHADPHPPPWVFRLHRRRRHQHEHAP
eukprot:29026-Pelagococcus_subviridis.AAC.13